MNAKQFMTTVSIVVFTLIAQAQKQRDMIKKNFNQEEKAVLEAVEKMTQAFHNKDIDGVMRSYETNAQVVFEPQKPITNATELRNMFLQTFQINPKFVYSGHEVFVNGNFATHFAPWTMTGEAPDGTLIQQNGLSVAVLRKQANGEWLMIFDNPHGSFLMQN